jgi:hypothetical protein
VAGQQCSVGGFVQNVAMGAELGGLTMGLMSEAGSAAAEGAETAAEDDAFGALGKAGCSFSPDTQVATLGGGIAIASLKVGDSVQAYDPKTGETGPHQVTAVMVHTDPVIEHLKLDTGPIETTPNHRFFTADRGWVEAGSLVVGEEVRTDTGHSASVTGFTLDATPSSMWDLTVADAHSFFVGPGAVLVHNFACVRGPNGTTGMERSPGWTPEVRPPGENPAAGPLGELARKTGNNGNINDQISGQATEGSGGGAAGTANKLLQILSIFFGG